MLATVITYKIRDNAAGLHCGSSVCIAVEEDVAEEGEAQGSLVTATVGHAETTVNMVSNEMR